MSFWSRRAKNRSRPGVTHPAPTTSSPLDGADPVPVSQDPASFPTPLSAARLAQVLRADGAYVGVDQDGDCLGIFHMRLFLFVLYGEEPTLLQIRGTWNREASIERLDEILDLVNDWNTDRIWPKAYARVRDDGAVTVNAEVSVNFAAGATDAQIGQVLRCGIASGTSFFDALDARYPDPVAQSPAL